MTRLASNIPACIASFWLLLFAFHFLRGIAGSGNYVLVLSTLAAAIWLRYFFTARLIFFRLSDALMGAVITIVLMGSY